MAPAITSSGKIAGWKSRSWKTEIDVEAARLRPLRERRVPVRPLVRLQPEPDLSQVSSSVVSARSPIRSIRITTRSSGIGAADQRILFEPVLRRQTALLRRDERQHGLQRVEAEVPPLRDPYVTRLGDLEVVADLSPQTERPSIRSTVTRMS